MHILCRMMRRMPGIAASLACVVLAYSTLSSFLECGTGHSHQAHTGAGHADGDHSQHHGHGASHPSEHHGSTPMGASCCNASLYNIAFECLHPAETLRAQAFTRLPHHPEPALALVATALSGAAFNRATGPPSRSGSNTHLYAARPRFLVLSSFLV
jgi:hypothetical protein